MRNAVGRGRQATLYRAHRWAEYALYDGDPTLIDSELDQYLAITPDEIKNAIRDYLDVDNRVTLDIIPAAMAAGEAASAQPPGEPQQPAAPAPQIPATPSDDQAEVVAVGSSNGGKVEAAQQPADPAKQTETGSGPLHT